MPSTLGRLLRKQRLSLGIGLRELARRIDKSPALLTRLEGDDIPPSVAPDTLRAIAGALDLEPDRILLMADRTEEMAPKTELEFALYRKIRSLSQRKQQEILKDLQKNDRRK